MTAETNDGEGGDDRDWPTTAPVPTPDAYHAKIGETDEWLTVNVSAELQAEEDHKAPRDLAGRPASWNDSTATYDLKTVREKANAEPEVGIGFVFQEDDDLGVIDLDGAIDLDSGDPTPKEWLPGLGPFADRNAWFELSFSALQDNGEGGVELADEGNGGLHIPVRGLEIPDWWTNVSVDDADHEGIEVYKSKFCASTGITSIGDKLEAGDEIVEHGDWLEQWLFKAYVSIEDEDPTADSDDGKGGSGDRGGTGNTDEIIDWIDDSTPSDWSLSSSFTEHENDNWESWDPGYRGSDSGKSLKYCPSINMFYDFIEGNGNPADCSPFSAFDIWCAENGHKSNPWDDLDGEDWVEAVEAARDDDVSIPEYEPPLAATDGAGAAVATGGVGPDLETEDWATVRSLFKSSEDHTTTQAQARAADLLLEEESFVCVRDSGELYWFDPDAGYYKRNGDAYLKEILYEEIQTVLNTSRISNIKQQVESRTGIDAKDFVAPESKVCVENGVIDLETYELLDHDPCWYFTAGLPVEYDPDAECPNWRQFVAESVESEAIADALAEYVAYCFETWHHRHEKNLFIVGPRRSGKSTFAETVGKLFGSAPTNVTLSPQQLSDNKHDSIDLYEAMVNIRNDINSRKIEDSGTLKTIFSGEPLKGERKFHDNHYFRPTAKHLFTANWLPRVVGEDESLYRRVIIAEFPNQLDKNEIDRTLDRKLEAELPGILNWALEGHRRLVEQGHFSYEPGTEKTKEQWLSWRDSPLRYLLASGEVTVSGKESDQIDRKTAYRAYKEWANRHGYTVQPQQGFTNLWKIAPHVETDNDSGFNGVRWNSDPHDGGLSNYAETGEGGDESDSDDETMEHKGDELNAVHNVLEVEYSGTAIPHGALCAAVDDRHGIEPERTAELLEKLAEQSRVEIIRTGSGKYKPL